MRQFLFVCYLLLLQISTAVKADNTPDPVTFVLPREPLPEPSNCPEVWTDDSICNVNLGDHARQEGFPKVLKFEFESIKSIDDDLYEVVLEFHIDDEDIEVNVGFIELALELPFDGNPRIKIYDSSDWTPNPLAESPYHFYFVFVMKTVELESLICTTPFSFLYYWKNGDQARYYHSCYDTSDSPLQCWQNECIDRTPQTITAITDELPSPRGCLMSTSHLECDYPLGQMSSQTGAPELLKFDFVSIQWIQDDVYEVMIEFEIEEDPDRWIMHIHATRPNSQISNRYKTDFGEDLFLYDSDWEKPSIGHSLYHFFLKWRTTAQVFDNYSCTKAFEIWYVWGDGYATYTHGCTDGDSPLQCWSELCELEPTGHSPTIVSTDVEDEDEASTEADESNTVSENYTTQSEEETTSGPEPVTFELPRPELPEPSNCPEAWTDDSICNVKIGRNPRVLKFEFESIKYIDEYLYEVVLQFHLNDEEMEVNVDSIELALESPFNGNPRIKIYDSRSPTPNPLAESPYHFYLVFVMKTEQLQSLICTTPFNFLYYWKNGDWARYYHSCYDDSDSPLQCWQNECIDRSPQTVTTMTNDLPSPRDCLMSTSHLECDYPLGQMSSQTGAPELLKFDFVSIQWIQDNSYEVMVEFEIADPNRELWVMGISLPYPPISDYYETDFGGDLFLYHTDFEKSPVGHSPYHFFLKWRTTAQVFDNYSCTKAFVIWYTWTDAGGATYTHGCTDGDSPLQCWSELCELEPTGDSPTIISTDVEDEASSEADESNTVSENYTTPSEEETTSGPEPVTFELPRPELPEPSDCPEAWTDDSICNVKFGDHARKEGFEKLLAFDFESIKYIDKDLYEIVLEFHIDDEKVDANVDFIEFELFESANGYLRTKFYDSRSPTPNPLADSLYHFYFVFVTRTQGIGSLICTTPFKFVYYWKNGNVAYYEHSCDDTSDSPIQCWQEDCLDHTPQTVTAITDELPAPRDCLMSTSHLECDYPLGQMSRETGAPELLKFDFVSIQWIQDNVYEVMVEFQIADTIPTFRLEGISLSDPPPLEGYQSDFRNGFVLFDFDSETNPVEHSPYHFFLKWRTTAQVFDNYACTKSFEIKYGWGTVHANYRHGCTEGDSPLQCWSELCELDPTGDSSTIISTDVEDETATESEELTTEPDEEVTTGSEETATEADEATSAPDPVTSESEDMTTEPEESTSEPEESTTESEESTSEPEESTTEPEVTTESEERSTEPEESTSEPEEYTTEPEVTTESEERSTEPEESTSEPEESTTEPEVTTESEERTTEPEESTSESEESTTESEESTSEPEESTSEPEESTTESEESTSKSDESTSEPEESPSASEDTTTETEEATVEPEESTTESEESTSESEESTTEPEESTSEPEEYTTEPEEYTTEPEESTHPEEQTTTESAQGTTQPEESTSAEQTSTEPEDPTTEADVTTSESEETTNEPDETTAESEEPITESEEPITESVEVTTESEGSTTTEPDEPSTHIEQQTTTESEDSSLKPEDETTTDPEDERTSELNGSTTEPKETTDEPVLVTIKPETPALPEPSNCPEVWTDSSICDINIGDHARLEGYPDVLKFEFESIRHIDENLYEVVVEFQIDSRVRPIEDLHFVYIAVDNSASGYIDGQVLIYNYHNLVNPAGDSPFHFYFVYVMGAQQRGSLTCTTPFSMKYSWKNSAEVSYAHGCSDVADSPLQCWEEVCYEQPEQPEPSTIISTIDDFPLPTNCLKDVAPLVCDYPIGKKSRENGYPDLLKFDFISIEWIQDDAYEVMIEFEIANTIPKDDISVIEITQLWTPGSYSWKTFVLYNSYSEENPVGDSPYHFFFKWITSIQFFDHYACTSSFNIDYWWRHQYGTYRHDCTEGDSPLQCWSELCEPDPTGDPSTIVTSGTDLPSATECPSLFTDSCSVENSAGPETFNFVHIKHIEENLYEVMLEVKIDTIQPKFNLRYIGAWGVPSLHQETFFYNRLDYVGDLVDEVGDSPYHFFLVWVMEAVSDGSRTCTTPFTITYDWEMNYREFRHGCVHDDNYPIQCWDELCIEPVIESSIESEEKTTIEPEEETTAEPEHNTTEPEISTTELGGPTTEPEEEPTAVTEGTTESDETTIESEEDTTTPQTDESTKQPNETTTESEVHTGEPGESTIVPENPTESSGEPEGETTTVSEEPTTTTGTEDPTTDPEDQTSGTEDPTTPEDPTTDPEDQTSGTEDPTTGTEDPTTGTDTPTGGTEDPTTGTADPTTAREEPTVGAEDPTTGAEEPTTGTEDPTTAREDPTTGTEDPTGSTEDPTTDPEDQTSGTEDPTTGPEDPTTTTDTEDPTTGAEDPTTDPEDPTTGIEDSTGSTEDPPTGAEDPTTGTEDPTTGTEHPTTGPEDPTTGTEEPTGSTEYSTTGPEDPTTGPEEPTLPSTEPGTDEPTVPLTDEESTFTAPETTIDPSSPVTETVTYIDDSTTRVFTETLSFTTVDPPLETRTLTGTITRTDVGPSTTREFTETVTYTTVDSPQGSRTLTDTVTTVVVDPANPTNSMTLIFTVTNPPNPPSNPTGTTLSASGTPGTEIVITVTNPETTYVTTVTPPVVVTTISNSDTTYVSTVTEPYNPPVVVTVSGPDTTYITTIAEPYNVVVTTILGVDTTYVSTITYPTGLPSVTNGPQPSGNTTSDPNAPADPSDPNAPANPSDPNVSSNPNNSNSGVNPNDPNAPANPNVPAGSPDQEEDLQVTYSGDYPNGQVTSSVPNVPITPNDPNSPVPSGNPNQDEDLQIPYSGGNPAQANPKDPNDPNDPNDPVNPNYPVSNPDQDEELQVPEVGNNPNDGGNPNSGGNPNGGNNTNDGSNPNVDAGNPNDPSLNSEGDELVQDPNVLIYTSAVPTTLVSDGVTYTTSVPVVYTTVLSDGLEVMTATGSPVPGSNDNDNGADPDVGEMLEGFEDRASGLASNAFMLCLCLISTIMFV
ncbi:Zonadhesin [Spathaspora sp. JA1]|nr:Zonadhesin [Spathaspora sp. JA1]